MTRRRSSGSSSSCSWRRTPTRPSRSSSISTRPTTPSTVIRKQEGRFFHGYYDGYCYLPLYVFCGRHLLSAKLRRSTDDASAVAGAEVEGIVARNGIPWPRVRIVLRAD